MFLLLYNEPGYDGECRVVGAYTTHELALAQVDGYHYEIAEISTDNAYPDGPHYVDVPFEYPPFIGPRVPPKPREMMNAFERAASAFDDVPMITAPAVGAVDRFRFRY